MQDLLQLRSFGPPRNGSVGPICRPETGHQSIPDPGTGWDFVSASSRRCVCGSPWDSTRRLGSQRVSPPLVVSSFPLRISRVDALEWAGITGIGILQLHPGIVCIYRVYWGKQEDNTRGKLCECFVVRGGFSVQRRAGASGWTGHSRGDRGSH